MKCRILIGKPGGKGHLKGRERETSLSLIFDRRYISCRDVRLIELAKYRDQW
jgi:hypothetical protein